MSVYCVHPIIQIKIVLLDYLFYFAEILLLYFIQIFLDYKAISLSLALSAFYVFFMYVNSINSRS